MAKRKQNPAFVYNVSVELDSLYQFYIFIKNIDNYIFLTTSYFSVVTFETLSDDYSKVCFIALVCTACAQEMNEWNLFL